MTSQVVKRAWPLLAVHGQLAVHGHYWPYMASWPYTAITGRTWPADRTWLFGRQRVKTKMAKINTLFKTKTAEELYPLPVSHTTYKGHISEYP